MASLIVRTVPFSPSEGNNYNQDEGNNSANYSNDSSEEGFLS